MITSDHQLEVMLQHIATFQRQVAHLRKTEKNPGIYRVVASGFLAEMDRMQSEVREYLSELPRDDSGVW